MYMSSQSLLEMCIGDFKIEIMKKCHLFQKYVGTRHDFYEYVYLRLQLFVGMFRNYKIMMLSYMYIQTHTRIYLSMWCIQ